MNYRYIQFNSKDWSKVTYQVTGIDREGKRLKAITHKSYPYISMINIYQGSIWMVENNKRTLVKRIYN
mgnify:CR=1 FL=1